MKKDTTLLAFQSNIKIKEKYLSRIKNQEKYDENGKSCLVSCTIIKGLIKFETELGIPTEIAYLYDFIFKNLKKESSKKWTIEFFNSINVGADLSLVWPKLGVWLLIDPEFGVNRFNPKDYIAEIADFYRKIINSEILSDSEYSKLKKSAEDAKYDMQLSVPWIRYAVNHHRFIYAAGAAYFVYCSWVSLPDRIKRAIECADSAWYGWDDNKSRNYFVSALKKNCYCY